MSNNFIKFTLFLSGFFTFCSTSFSMSERSNKIVSFHGEKKYIMRLLIDGCRSQNHPFSVTPVVRKKGNYFEYTIDDDIFNLTEDDFRNIHHGNYVYIDQYVFKKTRLSQGETVQVSTLFIGINDEDYCRNLNQSDFITRKQ